MNQLTKKLLPTLGATVGSISSLLLDLDVHGETSEKIKLATHRVAHAIKCDKFTSGMT